MEISKHPITIGTTIAIIGVLSGAWFFVDDYFAHADDVQAGQQQTIRTINDLRAQIIKNELNQLEAKIQYNLATKYDKVRKKQLEREWEQLIK